MHLQPERLCRPVCAVHRDALWQYIFLRKYFNIHSTSDDDKDVGKFLADYQVGLGRKFWGPYSYAYNKTHEVGKYPQMKPYSGNISVKTRIIVYMFTY